VNIGGDQGTPSLRITSAQVADVDGLPTLTLGLQNDGTALVKAQGDVTIQDASGQTVLSNKITLDTLVPQTSITYPVQADPPSQSGTYLVHASLDFGGAAPAIFDGNVTVTVKPTATALSVGRTRSTAVAGNSAPAAATTPAATTAAKSGGISPIVAVLSGIAGALLVLVIGLTFFIVRSRRTKPAPQAYYPPQRPRPPYPQYPQHTQHSQQSQQPPGQPYDPRRMPPPGTPR
jgi:hypothetical protein